MNTMPIEILRELEELRERFRGSTGAMVDEIALGWSVAETAPSPDRLRALIAQAHRLAGTAGTFALAEFSGPAMDLEDCLAAALGRGGLDEGDRARIGNLVGRLAAAQQRAA